VIAYHYGSNDTLSPEYVSDRESFYGVTSHPATVFDGTSGIIWAEHPEENYSLFESYIIKERNIAPKLRLHMEKNLVSSILNLKLHIVSIDSIENGNYRLFFVLYEDSVYFIQSGASDSIFYFVVREMNLNGQGVSVDLFYPDSIVKEDDFYIQDHWNTEKLGIVAFVQDIETKQVLQAIVDKRITTD